jgi:hypothetical protein
MLNLRGGVVAGLVLCACGGPSGPKKYSGSITVSAMGSWMFTNNTGEMHQGNETFNVTCTNDGSGMGKFSGTFSLHRAITDSSNHTGTTDASAMPSVDLTPDNTGCVLGTGNSSFMGVQLTMPKFNVTGMITGGGLNTPINDDWSQWDLAEVGTSAQITYSAMVASFDTFSGMVTFTSGDEVGGTPTTIQTMRHNPTGIPVTVSWTYAAVK